MLIIRHGKVVADAYFYPYDGSAPHDLSSVTKSIMTILIGIAVDQGKLKLDDSVLSFFPDATLANRSAAMEKITVRHLVMMANGLPAACRGQWENDDTFIVQLDTLGNRESFILSLHFLDSRLAFSGREGTHAQGYTVEGKPKA